MSRYLGVEANNKGLFYFISYSNIDAERVVPIIKTMERYDIPVWYDGGLVTGQKWEKEIADNIQNSEAVIMFISKNTFENELTYVKKEYDIASIRQKKVYVIFLDTLTASEIPNIFIAWWIDLNNLQNLNLSDFKTSEDLVLKICNDLGYSLNASDKIKRLKDKFDELSKEEREAFVFDYFEMVGKSENLLTKATFFAQIQIIGLKGLETQKTNNTPYLSFCCKAENRITISNTVFKAQSKIAYHAAWGNAEILQVFRDDILLWQIGGICDICDDEKYTKLYFDEKNDLLFISFVSTPLAEEQKYMQNRQYNPRDSISVAIIENPLGDALCHCYNDILLLE